MSGVFDAIRAIVDGMVVQHVSKKVGYFLAVSPDPAAQNRLLISMPGDYIEQITLR